MKLFNKSFAIPSILVLVSVFLACQRPKTKVDSINPASVTIEPGDKYIIDTTKSAVTYHGSMVIAANGGHTGHVYLSKGELLLGPGKILSGSVVVNMNTITDIKDGSDNNLIQHLKSKDFFEVEKFPTAGFAILVTVPVNDSTLNVTGNLTIKGITHPVTFPASIKGKDGVIRIKADLIIDRTRWGVIYDSGKFFLNIADHAISDEIRLEIEIVARKDSKNRC